MIPKKIHYCWFGGNPLPSDYLKNIETWKKYNPDYEIIEWNEKNYDIHKIKFIEEAYKEKKWAFVADYARLDIIFNNGGIYLDTDVEVLKNFDELLKNNAFMGMEFGNYVNTGIGFGAIKGHKGIEQNKTIYEKMSFYDKNGNLNFVNCPKITTKLLKDNGAKLNGKIEKVLDITIYPTQYFCPLNYYTGKITINEESYSIHKYSMSWGSKLDRNKHFFEVKLNKFIGYKLSNIFTKIVFFPFTFFERCKKFGLKKTIIYFLGKFDRT